MKQLLFILAFLALQSCGKSDGGSGVVTSTSDVGTVAQSQGGGTALVIQGSPNYYFVNYRFKEGTCDTDLHRFSGPTQEVVLAQVCAGLQNEWMNHSCARGQRQQAYAATCH